MTNAPAKIAPVFWFTGYSGAGKSTVATAAAERFEAEGLRVLILDGDDVRERLHQNLGFSEQDIKTNNTLIANMCRECRADHDLIIVPIISPYRRSRAEARRRLEPRFYEIYFNASIEVVRARDVKGLYSQADANRITNLIGYSLGSNYEPPEVPDLTLDTDSQSPETVVDTFCSFVLDRR